MDELIDKVVKFFSNPTNTILVIYGLYRLYKFMRNMYPTYDGDIDIKGMDLIENKTKWNKLLIDEKIIVVMFFATWCPQCKKALPLFTKLTEDDKYSNSNGVVFKRCNVDKALDVAAICGVSSIIHTNLEPVFKIYKNGKEIHNISGWNENKLKSLIDDEINSKK